MDDNQMDQRKLDILKAIISDYVSTGEPVGSRTLAKKYGLGISPATIRNEMADLEEMGYLESPHTSAGRIPSSKGYRVYVDQLMEDQEASSDMVKAFQGQIISMASYQIEGILRQASMLLSEMTNLAIVSTKPSMDTSRIKTIQLVNLGSHHLMVVIVLDNKQVRNTIVNVDSSPNPEDLLTLSNIMTAQLTGRSASEIDITVLNRIRQNLSHHSELFTSVMTSVHDALMKENHYIVEGKNNVLDFPEFNSITRAKEILEVLENPKDLIKNISEGSQEEFRIVIGEETNLPETKDMSVLSAKYQLNGMDVGSINLIGPKRLDYHKMSSILKSVVDELNTKLQKLAEEDDND